MHPLDLQQIPLRGWHAIEASAGTGKTYAIVHLVVRLVLEAGVSLEQIVLVTFTRAASEELRTRLRHRLRQARAAVTAPHTAADPALAAVIARVPRARAAAALEAAWLALDAAPIDTLHGFCGRILREYAFETAVAFDATLLGDDREWRALAVTDHWRRCLAHADRDTAAWLLEHWPQGPDDLLITLGPWLGPRPARLVPAEDPSLAAELAAVHSHLAELRSLWPQARDTVAALLRSPALNRTVYNATAVTEALSAVEALVAHGTLPRPLRARWALLTPAKLGASVKKGHAAPTHPVFAHCAALAQLETLDLRRRAAWLRTARSAVQAALHRFKEERQWLAFDDLIGRVAAALAGPCGPALAARLRARWPWALIDECQDADPLQYEILQRIYDSEEPASAPTAAGGESSGLLLVGDPKQAIYGFRGGDLHAYLAARQVAERRGRCWTLTTNWRATPALITAVNVLFTQVPQPFLTAALTFIPATPGTRAAEQPLTLDGAPVVPLEIRWLPLVPEHCVSRGVGLHADSARALAASDCAARIAAWLALGRAGRARLGDRPLAPGDIAVLVRKHEDGARLCAALRAQGVPSVSVARASVLDTEEARELAVLLAALRDGAPAGVVRAALATRLLGWDAAAIAALETDENGWEQVLARFDDYRRCWRERGLLAALWQIIHTEQVGARLRQLPDGERRLTDVLHLAELLHEVAGARPGSDALLQWLARGGTPADDSDERLLRLESDDAAVRVLTIHRSKGLEFPLVFLPCPWVGGQAPAETDPLPFHDESGRLCLDLGSAQRAEHRQRHERERLAEELRLLYVGLTRAARYCVLHWGLIHQTDNSALALLLHPSAYSTKSMQDAVRMRATLDELVARAPQALRVVEVPWDSGAERAHAQPAFPPCCGSGKVSGARAFTGRIRDDWRWHSFTSLTAAVPWEEHDPAEDDTREREAGAGVHLEYMPQDDAAGDRVPVMPRGPRLGRCLHELLEQTAEEDADVVARALTRHGLGAEWAAALTAVRDNTLNTPVLPDGGRLRDLPRADRLTEFRFHYALAETRWSALAAILHARGYAVPEFNRTWLRGVMTGAIDLVFRYAGRYYILDYKSHDLGPLLADYAAARLPAVIDMHYYRLQYLIYTIALHRYLRWRGAGYDYQRDFGGVYYLFVRGLNPACGTQYGVFFDRPDAELIAALEHLFHP